MVETGYVVWYNDVILKRHIALCAKNGGLFCTFCYSKKGRKRIELSYHKEEGDSS